MAPTEWSPAQVLPGETYRTDKLHVLTENLSSANGYPTTDAMSDDSTTWSAVSVP